MGQLRRHPVGLLQAHYRLRNFVETGLGPEAHGLQTALAIPFSRRYSVEALPEIIDRVRESIPEHRDHQILFGDSAEVVPQLLQKIEGPTLWWLDAHYPENYTASSDATPLPMRREVEAIVGSPRDHGEDVFLMDDWRVFGGSSWGSGPLPRVRGVFPADAADAARIRELLEPTHELFLDQRDEGYLVALPREPVRPPPLPTSYATT